MTLVAKFDLNKYLIKVLKDICASWFTNDEMKLKLQFCEFGVQISAKAKMLCI